MLAGVHAGQHEPVDQLAREPDPDAAAGDGGVGQPFGHEVVERAVQVRERNVHRHLGHRPLLRRRVVARPGARPGGRALTSWKGVTGSQAGLRHAPVLPEQER